MSATRIHARPCRKQKRGQFGLSTFSACSGVLAFALDVLMFSMFSMLEMQLFCTLLQASRMYSQKLRWPSELNQLPEPVEGSTLIMIITSRCFNFESKFQLVCPALMLPAVLPLKRWLRMCSKIAAKLMNSSDESSMGSAVYFSRRVFTENLKQKNTNERNEVLMWILWSFEKKID